LSPVHNSTTKPLLNPVRMPISLTWPVSHASHYIQSVFVASVDPFNDISV